MIQGSTLTIEIPVVAPVTSAVIMRKEGQTTLDTTSILYGTETGAIGVGNLSKMSSQARWVIQDAEKSAVNCIALSDLVRDGSNSILVGRNDGRVEVYSMVSEAGTIMSESGVPQKVFSRDIGESIRSIECGSINTAEHNEIVVAGYTGKIVSYTTEPTQQRAQDDTYGRSVHTVNTENRLKHLKKELEALKYKVDKDKEKLKKVQVTEPPIAPAADFPVNASFNLDPELAAYVLSVEIQSPIDVVILQSNVVLDLVETELFQSSTVVSVVPADTLKKLARLQSTAASSDAGAESARCFVATYRCQNKDRRITITMRTTEGVPGELQVTVVNGSAPKAAKVVNFPIKPLSLHSKVHELTEEEAGRVKSRLRFTGEAKLAVIHEWVQMVLPEVPPKLSENDDQCRLFFRNSFTGAASVVEYRRNEVIIDSDSVSVIAIAKETFSKMATNRRVQLEEHVVAKQESVLTFLDLIKDKLSHLLSLSKKMDIMDSIVEISQQEGGDISWLSPEYAEILKGQESINREFKDRARALEYLTGIVTDLFVDWHRLRGVEVSHRMAHLQQVINSGDFNALVLQFVKDRK